MKNIDNKSGIPPTTIGRERARYAEMRALDGVTDEQVDATVALDAQRYGVDLADYIVDLAAQKAGRAGSGKRESDARARDALITETQDFLSVPNLAIMSNRGLLEKPLTTQQKARAFDALGKHSDALSDHLGTCFDGLRGMSMLWSPYPDVRDCETDLLAVYIGGWEDGSKNLRYQYSPRKVPISKRSGYRDDSFACPIHGQTVKVATPEETPEETPEHPTLSDVNESVTSGRPAPEE